MRPLALADRIARRPVECEARDVDRYGRIVAVCRAGGEDLNAWLVQQGWALAYEEYAGDYVPAQAAAEAAAMGIWAGQAIDPALWRRGVRWPANDNAPAPQPAGCDIKGNISRDGERIYHVPGSRWYERTEIDEAAGERWFCTEEEAEAAGWRAPRP